MIKCCNFDISINVINVLCYVPVDTDEMYELRKQVLFVRTTLRNG